MLAETERNTVHSTKEELIRVILCLLEESSEADAMMVFGLLLGLREK